MRTFVIGDIHGNHKALQQCLERSGFDKDRDTLIQLGDIADGFYEVFECVEELLKIPNLIAIKGNHDNWLNDFILTAYHPTQWTQGGYATARSYLRLMGKEDKIFPAGSGYKTALNPEDIPETHRQFFNRQLLYHIDEFNNCYVHAGFNRHLEFKGQQPENYFWDRELWSAALSYNAFERHQQEKNSFHMVTVFNEIFIGHTPTINWNTDQPMRAANIHNLDTGAGHGGRLTIMDAGSRQFWQSDLVGKLYSAKVRQRRPARG
ncbi:MAG TPA: metallophosphoesterase [Waddliaceae bacterium]